MSANPQVSLRSVLGPQKFNYWYETLIDLLIRNPELTQGQRAARIGRTQSWVSLVEGSQGFRERYALRRAEHSASVSQNVEDKLHAAASLALDKLTHVLETKDLAPALVIDASDRLLQRLGYTGKAPAAAPQAPSGPMVVQIVAPVSAEVLRMAQTSIRSGEAAQISAHEASGVAVNGGPSGAAVDVGRFASGRIDHSAQEIEIVAGEVQEPPEDSRSNDPSFRRHSAE